MNGLLIPECRFDFICNGLSKFSGSVNQTRQTSPSPSAKPASMRNSDKENNRPEATVQIQGHRQLSIPSGFPPQVFQDSTFNPLYNPLNSYYNRPSEYEHSSFNDGTIVANGLYSNIHGDFKLLDATPRGPRQPSQAGYGAGPSNMSGGGMNFGI